MSLTGMVTLKTVQQKLLLSIHVLSLIPHDGLFLLSFSSPVVSDKLNVNVASCVMKITLENIFWSTNE